MNHRMKYTIIRILRKNFRHMDLSQRLLASLISFKFLNQTVT